MTPTILITEPVKDYELLDSGEGEKLERFGDVTLVRPDPQALWPKRLPESEWKKADGVFSREGKNGEWKLKKSVPEKWQISFGPLKFLTRPSSFKHVGIFPEQDSNWKWLNRKIGDRSLELGASSNSKSLTPNSIEVLNLFGYTGAATLACAHAGAKVVHVDGSKAAIGWARENAELSGLGDKPIRWILDDARTFVKREVKRGRKYAGIVMDPPAFGHGPKNELWKIEDHFLPLIEDCMKLLSDKPLFFLINGYSAGYSAIAYENNLLQLKKKFGGEIEMGELAIQESGSENLESGKSSRLLPCGIFARWSANK